MIKLLEYLRRSKLLFNLSLSLTGLCIFNRQKRNLFKAKRKKRFKQVRTLIPRDKIRGYVLVCYIPYTDNPQKLRQHAVVWSSHAICRLFLDKGYLVDVYPTATLTLFLAAATTSFLTITGILSVLPSFSPKQQKPSCFQKATNRLPTRLNGKELNVSAAAEKATPAGPAARVRTTVWTSPLPLPTLLRLSVTVKRYKLIRKNGAAN